MSDNWIYAAMFICFWVAVFCFNAYFDDECPRMILGYNCKGKICDHSDEAVQQAKWDMGVYSKYDY